MFQESCSVAFIISLEKFFEVKRSLPLVKIQAVTVSDSGRVNGGVCF